MPFQQNRPIIFLQPSDQEFPVLEYMSELRTPVSFALKVNLSACRLHVQLRKKRISVVNIQQNKAYMHTLVAKGRDGVRRLAA
jgi:hypothetical protein